MTGPAGKGIVTSGLTRKVVAAWDAVKAMRVKLMMPFNISWLPNITVPTKTS